MPIIIINKKYFNPRSPRGERPKNNYGHAKMLHISIHAPRGGSDIFITIFSTSEKTFQSTLPAGGATDFVNPCFADVLISIHAPRGGSDNRNLSLILTLTYFNPRSPRGERHLRARPMRGGFNFNPRSPRGERRKVDWILEIFVTFQSTLPAGGATIDCWRVPDPSAFQSTLPAGGAT